ncbi:MAG: serine/threonine-protein kinase [Planctomycetota bacterium]
MTEPQDKPEAAELVAACIDRYLERGEAAVEELCTQHPEFATLLRRRVARLRGLGLLEVPAAPGFPERLGEYQLLEPIGQGGMGAVYRAKQGGLGRDVALKLIRPDQLYFPQARERFRREVDAVARLRVPGVVPIHAVGQENGVPYYAMELVEGLDLARLIARVGARGGDPPLAAAAAREQLALVGAPTESDAATDDRGMYAGSWVQFCVRVALQAARTLAHVHAYGITHRDVKPSNLMLSASGAVTLLDFGLARDASAAALTRSGAVLGSLPYMAPEQLGGGASIDARTDVYGLGVTLFELLALRPAFAGTPAEVRTAILAGALPRLEDAPRDVETLCQKACEADPERRYPTAGAFADDLLRFLEFRPIDARRAGPILRARRWTQRHPARATAAMLVGLFALVGPAVYAWQQKRAAESVGRALQQSREFEQSYQVALKGALGVLDGAVMPLFQHEVVQRSGALDPVRRATAQRLSEFLEGLYLRDAEHPAIRQELAMAQERLAAMLRTLGEFDAAVVAAERAVELLGLLAASRPPGSAEQRHARVVMTGTNLELASSLMEAGQLDRAARLLHEMVDELDRLGAEDGALAARMLECQTALANILDRREQPAAAVALLDQWLPLAERLLERAQGDQEQQERQMYLGLMHANRAGYFGRLGDDEAAIEASGRAIALFADPTLPGKGADPRWELTIAHSNRGNLYQLQDRQAEAIEDLAVAVRWSRALVADYPQRWKARLRLARSLCLLGASQAVTQQPEAEATLLEARAKLEELLAERDDETLVRSLAQCLAQLGIAVATRGDDPALAVSHARAAVDRLRPLVAPGGAAAIKHVEALATARSNLVQVHYANGQIEEARVAGGAAMAEWRRACALKPDVLGPRRRLGLMARSLASICLQHFDDADAAAALLAEALRAGGLELEQIAPLREHLGEARYAELGDLAAR